MRLSSRYFDKLPLYDENPIHIEDWIKPIESHEINQMQSNSTQESAIRLRFDWVRQSNRNYSITFDYIRLVPLRFSFELVWLTLSGHANFVDRFLRFSKQTQAKIVSMLNDFSSFEKSVNKLQILAPINL